MDQRIVVFKHAIIVFFLTIVSHHITGQNSIDGSFQVQNLEKSYSLYIPQNYDDSTPNSMMLGLHPLNTARWNGESWRDTLIQFAETNNLLLVCPDGGADGRIDDTIDTLFTSILVDSIEQWYNINPDEKYIMGFSWGARTTYTYGLRRTSEYKGLLAIGAAVDITVISDVITEAKDQPIYVLHGSNDIVNTRYTPIVNALEDNEACLNTRLMQGVGHTIDFPSRNEILSEAFEWLKNANCMTSSTENNDDSEKEISFFPNPNNGTLSISNYEVNDISNLLLFNMMGRRIAYRLVNNKIIISDNHKGLLLLSYKLNGVDKINKIMVQ